MSESEFSWALLPTWRARYPRRYLVAASVLIVVGLSALGWMLGGAWRSVLLGVALGAILGMAVGRGRGGVEVVAGRFETTGPARVSGLTSNDVLGVEIHRGWWSAQASVVAIHGGAVRLPVVSWRIWPNRQFEEQVRGLRLALGMPAVSPPETT